MTTTLNAKRAKYFENPAHGKIDVLFFTSDDTCFKKEADAASQSAKLAKKGKPAAVDMITRPEYQQWKSGNSANSQPGETTNDPDNNVAKAQTQVTADNAQKAADGNSLAAAISALDAAKANGDANAIAAAQEAVDKATAQLKADNTKATADEGLLSAAQKAVAERAANKAGKQQAIVKEAEAAGATPQQIASING